MRLRRGRTLGLLVALVLAAGCGVKQPGELPVRTLDDGRLNIDPPPVSLTDLAREPDGTPRAAVLRLWFSIQWGDEHAIAAAYDPTVARALGPSGLVAAWNPRRSSVIGSRLRFIETTRRRSSAVVTFTRERRSAPPAYESATLVRRAGGWRVLHDTMLEDALGGRRASRRFRALAIAPGR